MDALERKLNTIDALKRELDGLRPLTPEQVRNLKALFDVEFTYNSAAIEGNTFSYQETKVVLLDGITVGGKSVREHLEITNHNEAIAYIEELSRRKPDELRRSDILNIHAIIMRGVDSKGAGAYRTVPVYVLLKDGSRHSFCEPMLIADNMDAFFDWLFSDKNEYPLITASEAHTRLVSIHPFADGNGRTARLLMNLLLLQSGYVPAVIKHADRVRYLDAIAHWQHTGSKEEFYHLVADYERESLETYLKTIREGIIWK